MIFAARRLPTLTLSPVSQGEGIRRDPHARLLAQADGQLFSLLVRATAIAEAYGLHQVGYMNRYEA
jgi:hypothetical protein